MKVFSPIVEMLLQRDDIAVFYLVTIQFPGETVRHTTLPYSVDISGLGLYSADSNLRSVEAPRLTTIVDRVAYKIVYLDPDFSFKDRFELGATGAPVSIHIGFFNPLDVTIGGAEPGGPLLEAADILLLYKGIIDAHGYAADDQGEVLATFECSSPMADLNQKTYFITTDSEQRKRNADDSSLQFMHIGAEARTMKWGKK